MADNLAIARRSSAMRKIKNKNTSPETALRLLIRKLGFSGYRLHRKNLPGRPDVAWIRRKLAIFVNGCFWHGHDCKRGSRVPKTNTEYWKNKIEKNRHRDLLHIQQLKEQGWGVLVVWECELKDQIAVTEKLKHFLELVSH